MFASNRRLNQSSSSCISISDNHWSENNANVNYGWNQASFTINKTQPFFQKFASAFPLLVSFRKKFPHIEEKYTAALGSHLDSVHWLRSYDSSWVSHPENLNMWIGHTSITWHPWIQGWDYVSRQLHPVMGQMFLTSKLSCI